MSLLPRVWAHGPQTRRLGLPVALPVGPSLGPLVAHSRETVLCVGRAGRGWRPAAPPPLTGVIFHHTVPPPPQGPSLCPGSWREDSEEGKPGSQQTGSEPRPCGLDAK